MGYSFCTFYGSGGTEGGPVGWCLGCGEGLAGGQSWAGIGEGAQWGVHWTDGCGASGAVLGVWGEPGRGKEVKGVV